MPSDLETLRATVITRLTEIVSAPRPTYEIDGRRFDWNGYHKQLWTMVKEIDEALASGEPYEFTTVYLDPSIDL